MVLRRYERGASCALIPVALLMALAACAPAVPDCSDAATAALLRQSVERQLRSLPGSAALEQLAVEFDAVRTLRRDFRSGAWQCAAELQVHASFASASNGFDVLDLAISALGGNQRLRFFVEQGPHELRYTSQFTDAGRHHVWSELR